MESPSATRCSAGASDADPLEVGDGGGAVWVAEGTSVWIGADVWPACAQPDASTTTASAATSHCVRGRVLSRCNAK